MDHDLHTRTPCRQEGYIYMSLIYVDIYITRTSSKLSYSKRTKVVYMQTRVKGGGGVHPLGLDQISIV